MVRQSLQQSFLRIAREQLVLVHDLLRALPKSQLIHAKTIRQVPLTRVHLAVLQNTRRESLTMVSRTLSSTIIAYTAMFPSLISSTRFTSSFKISADPCTAGERIRNMELHGTFGALNTIRTKQSNGSTNSQDSSSLRVIKPIIAYSRAWMSRQYVSDRNSIFWLFVNSRPSLV